MSLPNLKHAEGKQDMNTRFWLQNIYKRGKWKDEDVEGRKILHCTSVKQDVNKRSELNWPEAESKDRLL